MCVCMSDLRESQSAGMHVSDGVFREYRHRAMGGSDHQQDATQFPRPTGDEQLDAQLRLGLRDRALRLLGLLSRT